MKEILKDRSLPDAGAVLYDLIVSKINDEDKVVLDMTDVDTIPSMFLNTSIGHFIDDYGFDILKQKLSFEKISKTQADRIKNYIIRVTSHK